MYIYRISSKYFGFSIKSDQNISLLVSFQNVLCLFIIGVVKRTNVLLNRLNSYKMIRSNLL